MIIDHPDALKAVIEEAQPRETCRGGAFRLVNDLLPALQTYAKRWQELSVPVWEEMNPSPEAQGRAIPEEAETADTEPHPLAGETQRT
jgi:hypothetical protein